MGTSNFHNENCLYTIEAEYEFEYEDTISNITCEFNKDKEFYGSDSIKLESELRSFPARSIGSFTLDLEYLEQQITVTIVPLVRSGYYSGANFDYEMNIECEYSDYDDISDCVDDLLEYGCVHKGLLTAHRSSLENKVNIWITETVKKITDVYEMFTDQLVVTAQFSNGETFYAKVEED